jgi:hypothetical protein
MREHSYSKLLPIDREAICAHNLMCLGDVIGPTEEYFLSPGEDISSPEWALRAMRMMTELNGSASITALAKSRDNWDAALADFVTKQIHFGSTSRFDIPWRTVFEGADFAIRVNRFPDEVFYSLLLNGSELGSFNDWPKGWKKRRPRKGICR